VRPIIPIFRRAGEALRERDWFEIWFELFVVVLGVILGMEASRWTQAREDSQYRRQMIAAMDETLGDYIESGHHIHGEIVRALNDYSRRVASGRHPPPPYLRFPLLDRPPTRAWDAMVATGLARSIDPKLVFRLAMHFSRADSFGDRYARYNQFTEQQLLPYLNRPQHFYGPDGKLTEAYRSHVQRLRELLALNDEMTTDAQSLERDLGKER
jgi:hypothetical protein